MSAAGPAGVESTTATTADDQRLVLVGRTLEGSYSVIGAWTPDWAARGLEAARKHWTGPGLYSDVHLAEQVTTYKRLR